MPRCPKCNYILVLLEKRRKYKCAKCGNLYFKKIIEDAEFKESNKKQRQIDRKEYIKEKNSENRKRHYQEYKEKYREYNRRYAKENRDKLNKYCREYRMKNREEYNRKTRERYYRKKQKISALKMLENRDYKGCSPSFQSSLPTCSLSELLIKP